MIWLLTLLPLLALWSFDRPDRNPFQVARVYRLTTYGLLLLVVILGYKAMVWNRDLRTLILSVCQD